VGALSQTITTRRGLVADAIQDVTRRGNLVLIFFWAPERRSWQPSGPDGASVGSTFGSAYVDIATERWSARTGLEPHLEEAAS
jgi:hypothetical protein